MWAWAIALVVMIAGCGGSGSESGVKRVATPLDLTTTGTIRGEVDFVGTPPPMKELPVASFPGCEPATAGPVLTGETLVANGHVQNVFVYLKSGLGNRVFAVPETPVEIDQLGCVYLPRVAGAQVGQPVLYKNSDGIMHNVRGAPAQNSAWNVSLAGKGMKRSIQLDKAEVMVPVRCDVHPWMQSYVGVVDHPYFAVTGPDGHFELKQVPPGDYTVAIWHEKFGTKESTVTLSAQGNQSVTFTYSAGAPN